MDRLIESFAAIAKRYLASLEERRVFPSAESLAGMSALDIPLPLQPVEPLATLSLLDRAGSPATVASAGSRYFGFVIGGSAPAPLAANLLASVWDQNAGLEAASPVGAFLETVCLKWLLELFGLPPGTGAGFVTGATMANFTCLAAARHALLTRAGWDVENDGLFGAPPVTVIVGDEVHVSVLKALSLLGFGRKRVVRAPVDRQGRMLIGSLKPGPEPSIICAQAGNVNTGAFDPLDEICGIARLSGSWVHVDGAFGLWARVSTRYAHLASGLEQADSWSMDAHKWLNVPYDSGIALVRQKEHLVAAMSAQAAYLASGGKREPFHYVPEMSRRARGTEIWAALHSLGKQGLASIVESNCACAALFAEKLRAAGFRILNEVVLNQVLVSFGDSEKTRSIIRKVQEDGTCWCGPTEWQGETAMRISVSSWKTGREDIEKSSAAIIRIASEGKA